MKKSLFLILLNSALFVGCMQGQPINSASGFSHAPAPISSDTSWRPAMEVCLLRIKSRPLNEIGYEVYDIASTWAAAGFIQQANALLSKFWSYKVIDPNNFKYANNGFRVLWALSGQQPDSIPFELRNVKQLVQENWDDLFNPGQWAPSFRAQVENKDWKELKGNLLLAKSILLSYDNGSASHRSSPAFRAQAVEAFTHYFSDNQDGGYALFHSTACASLVACSLGEIEPARAFIRAWGRGYIGYPQNYMLSKLMCDTASGRLLLRGVLAPVWGLTQAFCDSSLIRVESVLDDRIKNGPSLIYGQLSLQQLLQRISEQAIKNKKDLPKEALLSHWLGYAPATANEIAAAEKRLGVQLPLEYKSLLLLTNGFQAPSNIGINFLPVEKIGWLKDLDGELVKIWGEPMDEKDTARAEGFKRSILIGGYQEEQQFLLVPPDSHHPDWQYWFFANWIPGIEPCLSLRYYLEKELLRMEKED